MRKTDGLDQIFIQSQRASDGAAQLRDFQRMGKPRAKQVTLMIYKNLGLVDQAPKGRRVNNAIAIPLIVAAGGRYWLIKAPTTTVRR